jgi:hypothetical protein
MKLNDLKVLNLLFSDLGFIKEVNDRGYTVFLKKIDQVLNGVSYRKTPENTLPPIGEQIRLLVNPGDAHKDFGMELKKAFTEKWNRNTPDHQRLTLQDIHKFYGVGKSVSIGSAEHGKHSGYVSATIHRIVDLENSTLVFVEHKHYIPIFEFGLDGKLKVVQEYNQSWLAP